MWAVSSAVTTRSQFFVRDVSSYSCFSWQIYSLCVLSTYWTLLTNETPLWLLYIWNVSIIPQPGVKGSKNGSHGKDVRIFCALNEWHHYLASMRQNTRSCFKIKGCFQIQIIFFSIVHFLNKEHIVGAYMWYWGLLSISYPVGSVHHKISHGQLTVHLCTSWTQENHSFQEGEEKQNGFLMLCEFVRMDLVKKEIQWNLSQ